MSRISVTFDRQNALKYQESVLSEMIDQAEAELQQLQDDQQQRSIMRNLVNDSLEVWQPLADILQPMNKPFRVNETVKYQRMLIDFMKIKKQAVVQLIEDQEDPKVYSVDLLKMLNSFSDLGCSTFT